MTLLLSSLLLGLPELDRWQGAAMLFFGASIVFTMAGVSLRNRRK